MLDALREWVAAGLLIVGSLFLLLASVALLRMPDLYGRISASSKAVTAGAGACLLAAAVAFSEAGAATRALAGIAFFLLTSPVAAHVVARAATYLEIPFAPRTRLPELDERGENALRNSR